jgi:isopropylmalate/homocitrate/citramalate synthase
MYTQEQLQSISEKLASLPAQKQNLIEKKSALKMLTRQIRELHSKKHYEPKEIVGILKENGITTTQREIKALLVKTSKLITKKSGEKTTEGKGREIAKNIQKLEAKAQPKTAVKTTEKTPLKSAPKTTSKTTQKRITK